MGNTDQIKITVITPTYNRAHTLSRTYESLVKQDCKNFIWLIIDDGSVDNTEDLVKNWKTRPNGFEIQYIYKENGGKHTACNIAYENIGTELNIIIDSDDCLGENAISLILNKWEQVKDKGYSGIIGLNADMNGKIIGTGFPRGMEETALTEYYKAGGRGDKALVYRTDIIKALPPYPVFEGEKYFPIGYIGRLIDQSWQMAVLDKVLCNVEYQADGLTANKFQQYLQCPRGFAY